MGTAEMQPYVAEVKASFEDNTKKKKKKEKLHHDHN